MNYPVVIFGVKDSTKAIIQYIEEELIHIDLIVTISSDVTNRNHVAGYTSLEDIAQKYGIQLFQVERYEMDDDKTKQFFAENDFDLGMSMGWQRLIPESVLERFHHGVFGFHGNCGYLPFGRGRSPLNWSMILGDTRFNLNLFRYDRLPDSPNVFATEMFSINEHDDIRTAQYKNLICSKRLLKKLVEAYQKDAIEIRHDSRDFSSWYNKRTAEDGKIDFKDRTRNIYNLIRGVAYPFPGAFSYVNQEHKIIIWEAQPFDEMIDFSRYAPGEIVEIFDGKLIVRTVDGSLLINRYECDAIIKCHDILA